ncbi:MAG: nitronate monooxygenase [Methylobacterium sp.]|nr:nitronate monooxygenase [Methylobacterium sp.]MCA3627461.1 nitronate monooxygenase [Methylobacterium sp.]
MKTAFGWDLALPIITAPMFIVSGRDLVLEAVNAGFVGTFPALNLRTTDEFRRRLDEIGQALGDRPPERRVFGVNLVAHPSNPRLSADLEAVVAAKVPLVITSLGAVSEIARAVQGYGGLILHDVINRRHAEKAAEAGVDGLVLVAAGAGGHAGLLNPFAFIAEVRQFFRGAIALAGALSTGADVAAALAAGADFAYMGTRFIATAEANAKAGYREMLARSGTDDIVYTAAVSGVAGNFLAPSLRAHGIDPAALTTTNKQAIQLDLDPNTRKWVDLWAAGQGVSAIADAPPMAELAQRLRDEFEAARQRLASL